MSIELSTEQLDTTLADVRQAYRLVGEYQKRVFSIMSFIAERFPEVGFFYWSPARWDTPPNRGSNPLSKWALDGLPYYTFSTLYVEPGEKREARSSWMLEIHHRADPGLLDDSFLAKGREPSLADLPPASEGSSELHLVAWLRLEKAGNADWRWGAWDYHNWPTEDGLLETVEEGTFSQLRHRLDLATITSRSDLERAVDNFREALFENGFPLKAVDPKT